MTMLDYWNERPILSTRNYPSLSSDWDRMYQNLERIMGPWQYASEDRFQFFSGCDIEETEDDFRLHIDMPGMDKEDIDINVTENTVAVSGERKNEAEKKEVSYIRIERRFGRFERIFSLPKKISEENIEAHYDHGVLFLILPKSEKAKTKHIHIKTDKPSFVSKFTGKTKGRSAVE